MLLVGGLLKEADCFTVFTALAERFQREGERIAAFSDHPLGSLLGFYSLDHIWDKWEDSENEKVKKLNAYLNLVSRKSGASLILLEAPDAIIKYNDMALNGFGIRSYMLCQAASPDYLVGCIPFGLAGGSLLDMLGEDFKIRLGCGFSAVHVSNVLLDSADTQQKQRVEKMHVDLDFVQMQLEKERGKTEIPMFDVIREGIEGVYERIKNYG